MAGVSFDLATKPAAEPVSKPVAEQVAEAFSESVVAPRSVAEALSKPKSSVQLYECPMARRLKKKKPVLEGEATV